MTALLVVLMIVVFVVIDMVVMARRRRRRGRTLPAMRAMRPPQPPFGVFLDDAHGWLRLHADGTLRVGIDDFLAEALGRLDAVEAPPVGAQVKRGEPLLTLRVGTRRLEVPSPTDGQVVALNYDVLDSPRTLTADPYGLGWVVGLWTRDQKQAIAPLQLGSGAAAHLRAEYHRLIDFLTTSSSGSPAPMIADGGLPTRGALAGLSDPAWERFQRQFLEQKEQGR